MHLFILLYLALLCAGCAVSPESAEKQRAVQEDIETILSEPLETDQYTQSRRCLRAHEYRDFRVLDNRHIVFEGRHGELWINTLRMRCHDLRGTDVLRVKSTFDMGRICDMDTFEAGEWFDYPWYGRWRRGRATASCSLGEFQQVTEAQVAAIGAALTRKE
jgi:hypothetical protein|tara:strand:+ start:351 stop:833 length:483 start_codon:yes stop_codon:yes gene_type:complete